MKLSLNKQSALAVLRYLRSFEGKAGVHGRRTDISAPDPSPAKRWSKRALDFTKLGLPILDNMSELHVAVPDRASRIRVGNVQCTVYSEGIPEKAFIDLGNGISVSGPELIFLEFANTMSPLEHLMLGHELCGSFSRDPLDPYGGAVTYGVRPLTSASRIRDFLSRVHYVRSQRKASIAIEYLDDNAWSPTESLIAALLRLPMDSFGFEFEKITLNPRVEKGLDLPGAKTSRYPDILIGDTNVGINYDGLLHFDLGSIADAGVRKGASPDSPEASAALSSSILSVREKLVDDIRRNRELAAQGLAVLPVLKEDLYARGGFDQLMAALLDLLEEKGGMDCSVQRRILKQRMLSNARHRMILSLLPGSSERDISVGRFIGGLPVSTEEETVAEFVFEL